MEDKKRKTFSPKEIIRNFQMLQNNFNKYTDKFLIEMNEEGMLNYEIEQNFDSIKLIWEALFYPTPASCFFVELVNIFGELEINTTIPYSSYSQSLTTFCLKALARKDIIKIEKQEKAIYKDLDDYENLIGTHRNKEVLMYKTFFYKIRDLTKEDLPLLKSIANMLQIDFFIYEIQEKNNKLFLNLKEEEKKKNIKNGKMMKNLIGQRGNICYFLSQVKKELFYKDTKEETKRLRKKK